MDASTFLITLRVSPNPPGPPAVEVLSIVPDTTQQATGARASPAGIPLEDPAARWAATSPAAMLKLCRVRHVDAMLAEFRDERIRSVCAAALQHRDTIGNMGGWVVAALKHGWAVQSGAVHTAPDAPGQVLPPVPADQAEASPDASW